MLSDSYSEALAPHLVTSCSRAAAAAHQRATRRADFGAWAHELPTNWHRHPRDNTRQKQLVFTCQKQELPRAVFRCLWIFLDIWAGVSWGIFKQMLGTWWTVDHDMTSKVQKPRTNNVNKLITAVASHSRAGHPEPCFFQLIRWHISLQDKWVSKSKQCCQSQVQHPERPQNSLQWYTRH